MARMLNLVPPHALVNLLAEIESKEDAEIIKKFVTSHASGLDFLPATLHSKQTGHITPDNIRPFFRKAATIYDYIIVDAGNSFSETLLTVLDNSNLILLVATPDILAVYQLKWCLELLQSLHFPINMARLILNRSESYGGVAWREVRTALACEIFAHIPSDGKTVGMALNRGVPCVMDSPRSKVAEAFTRMVNDLKKEDIFIKSTDIARIRGEEKFEQPGCGQYLSI